MSLLKANVALTPAEVEAYAQEEAICVVTDIFRATTTIVTALANGAEKFIALETIQEAQLAKEQGHLVGAERNCERIPFAHWGNDPLEYEASEVQGKTIYFTTTNGTRTIKRCLQLGFTVIIGSFNNLTAVARYCKHKPLLAVCAGWQGRFCMEDALFAGALLEKLTPTHYPDADAARMLLDQWQQHNAHLESYLRKFTHYQRLVNAAKAEAIPFCLEQDLTTVVPLASIQNGQIVITPNKELA